MNQSVVKNSSLLLFMNRIVLFEVNGNRNAKVKYPVFAWMEALAFYLVFNLRGPKTAPRAHMGRPV